MTEREKGQREKRKRRANEKGGEGRGEGEGKIDGRTSIYIYIPRVTYRALREN